MCVHVCVCVCVYAQTYMSVFVSHVAFTLFKINIYHYYSNIHGNNISIIIKLDVACLPGLIYTVGIVFSRSRVKVQKPLKYICTYRSIR